MESRKIFTVVWDPLELIVIPEGVPIPLACWCELQLSVSDLAKLQEYVGCPSPALEEWKPLVKERFTPSVRDCLQRKYTRQDWRQATLTRSSTEAAVEGELKRGGFPGLEIERFLIRSICTFE